MDISLPTPPVSSTASPHPSVLPSSPTPPVASDITTKLAALNLCTPNPSNYDTAVAKVAEAPDEDDDMLPVSVATKFLSSAAAPNCLLTSHILRDLWSTVYWVWKHPQKTSEKKVFRKFEELCEKLEDRHNTVLGSLNTEKILHEQLWKEKFESVQKQRGAEKELWEEKLASSENALKASGNSFKASENALKAEQKVLRDTIESHHDSVRVYKALNMELRELLAQRKSMYLASHSVYQHTRGRSVTRATAWNSEPVESLLCPDFVDTYALTVPEEGVVKNLVEELMGEPASKEGTYYTIIEKGLSHLLPGCSVINSSKKNYLLGESLDISICIQGVRQAHRLATHGIIEVKSRKQNVDAAQWLGQVKDYLLDLFLAQWTRNDFWAFIINVNEIFLVECKRKDTKPGHRAVDNSYHLLKYGPLSWVQMIHYIRGVTSTPNMGCKPLPFSPTLGVAEELIGGSHKWRIGRFAVPGTGSEMVVKVSLGEVQNCHTQELKILRHLKGCMDISSKIPNGVCKLQWDPARNLGKNVYQFNDIDQTPRIQFGLSPAGTAFSLDAFQNMESFRECISELLDALQWLHHTAGVIHRDVRVANVVLVPSSPKPVLIDFDCAIQLPAASDPPLVTTYSGGLICVPPRVVKKAIKESLHVTDVTYNPQIEDDYCALVLLVLELVFPKKYRKFPRKGGMANGGGSCLAALRRLHKDLAVNPTWGHLWDKAQRGATSELQDLASVILWIEED
ncbi:hypothetical protein BGX38DRAFT_1276875 [Terfezia claveryi]|nr:hypothetical protein BGX38DRAFT_1276875 [Terfezia claveryi]